MLRAGSLGRRVSLQRQTSGQNEGGEPVKRWTEYAYVPANVRMLTGKETIAADKETAVANASIRVRFRTDVIPGDLAVCAGVTFSINAVLPDLAKRESVDLVCSVIT